MILTKICKINSEINLNQSENTRSSELILIYKLYFSTFEKIIPIFNLHYVIHVQYNLCTI